MEQLLDAQRSIDAATYPDNAAALKAEISRRNEGGKTEPTESKKKPVAKPRTKRPLKIPFIDSIPKSDRTKIVFFLLVATLSFFLMFNLYLFVGNSSSLRVISILVQSTVLAFLLSGLRGAPWVVRAWALMVILAGVAYWVSVIFELLEFVLTPEKGPLAERITKLSFDSAVGNTVLLALGVLFYARAPDVVALRRKPKPAATPSK